MTPERRYLPSLAGVPVFDEAIVSSTKSAAVAPRREQPPHSAGAAEHDRGGVSLAVTGGPQPGTCRLDSASGHGRTPPDRLEAIVLRVEAGELESSDVGIDDSNAMTFEQQERCIRASVERAATKRREQAARVPAGEPERERQEHAARDHRRRRTSYWGTRR